VTFSMAIQATTLLTIPLLLRFRGYPLRDGNWLISGWALIVLLTELPSARLSDRLGRQRFILLGSAAACLGGFLAAFVPALWAAAVSVALLALGFALSFSPSLARVSELVGTATQMQMQSINGAIQGCGLAAVPLLVGALYSRRPELIVTVPAVTAAAGVAAFALLVTRAQGFREAQPVDGRPATGLVRDAIGLVRTRQAIRSAAAVTVLFTVTILFFGNSLAPTLLSAETGHSEASVTGFVGVRNLLAAAICLCAIPIYRRVRLRGMMAVIAAVTMVSTVALLIAPTVSTIVLVALTCQGLGLGLTVPLANSLVYLHSAPHLRAQAFTVVAIASRLTLILSPVVTGAVTKLAAPREILSAACVLILLMCLVVIRSSLKLSEELP
jgi:MFS family permease